MRTTLSIDHFGAAGSQLIEQLLKQDSNTRARRVALNNIGRLAKATGIVPKKSSLETVGLVVNKGGLINLMIEFSGEEI